MVSSWEMNTWGSNPGYSTYIDNQVRFFLFLAFFSCFFSLLFIFIYYDLFLLFKNPHAGATSQRVSITSIPSGILHVSSLICFLYYHFLFLFLFCFSSPYFLYLFSFHTLGGGIAVWQDVSSSKLKLGGIYQFSIWLRSDCIPLAVSPPSHPPLTPLSPPSHPPSHLLLNSINCGTSAHKSP